MSADVYYTTSSPHGHAVLLNEVTHDAVSIGFNPPSGTTYVGNTAEWILERPTLSGGSYADLPNYASMMMTVAEASNGTEFFYPGSTGPGTIYAVSMVCPPWNPSSACATTTTISYTDSYVPALYTFSVSAEGPAY